MCPILGAGFAPLSGNMRGRKRGEAEAVDPPRGWVPALLMERVRGRAWVLVCPSLCCREGSKGGPYVPCFRVRTGRKAGLALGERAGWLMLSMLRNSDAGLRF